MIPRYVSKITDHVTKALSQVNSHELVDDLMEHVAS